MNLGVAHEAVRATLYASLWERPTPDFVQEPEAVVRSRLGRLVADRDRSWGPGDPASALEITRMLASHGLPFLDRIRTIADMADYVRDRPGHTWVERVTEALVLRYSGDAVGGCGVLTKLAQMSPDPHLERLMTELDCGTHAR